MKELNNNSIFEYKGWSVIRKIGSGSFGTVYEIGREDFGYQYRAALKVISIPQSEQDLEDVKHNIGKSDESLEVYYDSVASEIVKEFELMYKLRGSSNIVSYEDHEVRRHRNGIGWDIMIRMELLTSLDTYIREHPMKREEVIRLGIDICKGLERCGKYNVIHRDIKPGNIFVSEQGDFKLGDFGIARTIEAHNEVLELSRKGTINYMAPEIYKGDNYNFNVDIYSLGIVMYRLLNYNTLPFISVPPYKPTYKDVSIANQRRFGGEPLPAPCGDNTQLSEVILKACSFHPGDRYQSPQAMRMDLEEILHKTPCEDVDDRTLTIFYINDDKSSVSDSSFGNKNDNMEEVSEMLGGASGSKENQTNGLSTRSKYIDESSLPKKKTKLVVILGLIIGIISLFLVVGKSISFKHKEEKNLLIAEQEQQGEQEKTSLQTLIENKDFISSYKIIQDSVKAGKNSDEEIKLFVHACEEELEYKRAVAAMKLLSDNVAENEEFYRETIQWFFERDKDELAQQIILGLRSKGDEGNKLADVITGEYGQTNSN